MEKKEQKHLYADTVEQNKRANHFLAIGYIVFYLCVLCVVGIACLRGIRTVGYTVFYRRRILSRKRNVSFGIEKQRNFIFGEFVIFRQAIMRYLYCGE